MRMILSPHKNDLFMFSKRLLPFSATSTTVLIKVSRNTLTKSHTTTRSASPAASPAASPLLRVQSNSMQLKRLFHIPSTKTAALFFATLASTSTPNTINSKTQSNGAMAFSTCSSSSPSSSVIRSGFVPKIADPDPDRVATIREYGAELSPLDPLGAEIRGLDLKKIASTPPPQKVIDALQGEMAERGFLVFKNNPDMTVDEQVAFSCWWGAHRMHSTHGVHPATPDRNRHIFRLSNDRNHGILGVGPQWHNDGSFESDVFSHALYYSVRKPENGGGTHFCHQGVAFDALPDDRQRFWERLTSVNSNSGVAHPAVHEHYLTGRKSVWLHLGMTGAVLEHTPEKGENAFRLLNEDEMKRLFNEYNDLLNAGLEHGYAQAYEYDQGDCIVIDNLAIAHRAAPEAHKSAKEQGLRIVHRTTVQAPMDFEPSFGLPQYLNIHGPKPVDDKDGVWLGGGVGFRWKDDIHMQN